mmetsp:Transcript_13843/g.39395  ORF Transcript_13843/g.39395 Transcript_13843/m.39395 type:complete len:242 (+) Transcript_13843:5279-6004(+)
MRLVVVLPEPASSLFFLAGTIGLIVSETATAEDAFVSAVQPVESATEVILVVAGIAAAALPAAVEAAMLMFSGCSLVSVGLGRHFVLMWLQMRTNLRWYTSCTSPLALTVASFLHRRPCPRVCCRRIECRTSVSHPNRPMWKSLNHDRTAQQNLVRRWTRRIDHRCQSRRASHRPRTEYRLYRLRMSMCSPTDPRGPMIAASSLGLMDWGQRTTNHRRLAMMTHALQRWMRCRNRRCCSWT